MNAEEMKVKLQELKNQAQSLLDANNIAEAEEKTLEVKILNAQIEIQEKLDSANLEVESLSNSLVEKSELIENLTQELETVKSEKTEVINKYNAATETVAELTSQVSNMKPIVEKFEEEQRTQRLNDALNSYKARFEKVGGSEVFESEEVQNLVELTINDDESVSTKAKCDLSDKINEILDAQDKDRVILTNVQEKAKKLENLNQTDDEFEKTYGFKKE